VTQVFGATDQREQTANVEEDWSAVNAWARWTWSPIRPVDWDYSAVVARDVDDERMAATHTGLAPDRERLTEVRIDRVGYSHTVDYSQRCILNSTC
jgi:hypothetical protein